MPQLSQTSPLAWFNKMTSKITILPTNSKNITHLYKPMLILLLIFGFNFDFYNHKFILKILSRLYCVTLVAVVTYATLRCCEDQEISQLWTLLEYSSSVLIILFFKSQVKVFCERLGDIDVYLRIRKRHYLEDTYKMFVLTLLVWTARTIYTYLYCLNTKCFNDFCLYFISLLAPFALDLNRVWRCILFDTVRYRLKMLRVRLKENSGDNIYLYCKNSKTLKEDKMKFGLFLYRIIAEMIDLVSPELHASLFLGVTCSLPKMIINVYHILTIMEGVESYDQLGFALIHLTQISVLLFTPFLIVEFFAIEVERIVLILTHRLIEESDPVVKDQIELFLRYIRIRPLKYMIWRVIPINMTLPLGLVNLCITYVIVILNFTHLYG